MSVERGHRYGEGNEYTWRGHEVKGVGNRNVKTGHKHEYIFIYIFFVFILFYFIHV